MSRQPRIWLYPINEDSDCDYVFSARGREWPTTPGGFAEMIRHGGGDDRWTIRANRRRVAPGDQVVVYASKKPTRPPLIVGVGALTSPSEWYKQLERYTIRIRWDRQQCLGLAVTPIDATHLMERLPTRKAAVMELPSALERWVRDRLRVREGMAERFRKHGASILAGKVKSVTIKRGAYRASLRHDARLVAPLQALLRRAGWDILGASTTSPQLEADIVAIRSGQSVIVEAKTTKQGDGRQEIREAIGQLLEYEYFLLPRVLSKRQRERHRLIVLEHAPRPDLPPSAERIGFLLAWFRGKALRPGPKTAAVLNKLLS